MWLHEKLYQAYLEEISALEGFKKSHYAGRRDEDLSEDPDIQRLTEALAFLLARNRLHGEEKVLSLYKRLFSQYFAFLASPLPAMALMQVTPSLDLPEKVICPEGTEVSLKLTDGRHVYCQTMGSVEVLPLALTGCRFQRLPSGCHQFAMEYRAGQPLVEDLATFKFYINQLHHFPSSLTLAYALKRCLKGVQIYYDDEEEGVSCPFSFGGEYGERFSSHPIERIRSLLHFPEQELFLKVEVPKRRLSWQIFSLRCHLTEEWPSSLQLTHESLLPFVVPIVNVKREHGQPISSEGKRDRYPILHPTPESGFTLHSVVGVYQIRNHRMNALKPGIISCGDGSYEVEIEGRGAAASLLLAFVDAVQTPKLISVDAFWTQPWFSHSFEQGVTLKLLHPFLIHGEARVLGKWTLHEESTVSGDLTRLMHLLALKNREVADLREILFLCNILKDLEKSHFRVVVPLIEEVAIIREVNVRHGYPLVTYHFLVAAESKVLGEMTLQFFKYLKQLLTVWSSHTEVEVTISHYDRKNYSITKER